MSTEYVLPFIINGAEYRPEQKFDVVSPDTGKVVHQCSLATSTEALAAIDAAAKAFPAWRDTPARTRRDILLKTAEVMERRRPEFAQYMQAEVGAAPQWADFNLNVAIDFVKDVAGRVSAMSGSIPGCDDPGVGGMILREPLGVVLGIAPWNAPYILGMRSVLYPIAAGNTAVMKGSEAAPRVFWAIASAFHEAGLPNGVLNFISTDPAHAAEVTNTLISNPQIKKINFTGSTAVGRIIAKTAAEHLKPVLLELGGKAPAIVWEDADLDIAAQQCVLGSFLNSGQICMSTEKIVVHKKVSGEFQKRFLAAFGAIFPAQNGAPILINAAAVDKVKKLVRDAVAKGGNLILGDLDAQETSGTRLRPMVVAGVTPEMDLYKTESFGPCVSLIEVETEEEALRIANDTEYGLTSAVFTEDLRTGLRFAKGIESGAVHINNMTIHDEASLPHGGAKASGYGRFNADVGLNEWVRMKTVTYRT